MGVMDDHPDFPKRNCHTQQLQDVRVLLDGVALLTAGRCGCGTEQESRDGEDGTGSYRPR